MYNYFYQTVRPTNNIGTLKRIICFVKLYSHMYCVKGDEHRKIILPPPPYTTQFNFTSVLRIIIIILCIYHKILLILTMILVSLISA